MKAFNVSRQNAPLLGRTASASSRLNSAAVVWACAPLGVIAAHFAVALNPSGLPHLALMGHEQDKSAINERLARCRQLAKQYVDEPTATHIRELEAELAAQLRRLEAR
jgi:uncharacterized protein YciW